jgi:hypothetical protein
MGYDYNGGNDTGVPLEMIKAIIKGFHVPYFIETGTASGMSIRKASLHFEKCHSIEIIEGRTPKLRELVVQDEADPTIVEYFQVPIHFKPNITLHIGNTVEVLPTITAEIGNEYAVYWLDAHYSDPVPSEPDCVECPVIDEVMLLPEKSIIVIDDARLFFGTPPPPSNPDKWCDIMELMTTLKKCFPTHHTTIIDDFVVSVPVEMKRNLNDYWLETYNQRFK